MRHLPEGLGRRGGLPRRRDQPADQRGGGVRGRRRRPPPPPVKRHSDDLRRSGRGRSGQLVRIWKGEEKLERTSCEIFPAMSFGPVPVMWLQDLGTAYYKSLRVGLVIL